MRTRNLGLLYTIIVGLVWDVQLKGLEKRCWGVHAGSWHLVIKLRQTLGHSSRPILCQQRDGKIDNKQMSSESNFQQCGRFLMTS